MKRTKKERHPRARDGKNKLSPVSPTINSIAKELAKSIPTGLLPVAIGRLPVFLPRQKPTRVEEKSILKFEEDLSFVGHNKKIKEICVDGYLMTTQEEDILLFLARKAIQQQSRLVRTSYAEIARVIFGKKKLNTEIRKKIDESLRVLAKTEISITREDGIETTFGFVSMDSKE